MSESNAIDPYPPVRNQLFREKWLSFGALGLAATCSLIAEMAQVVITVSLPFFLQEHMNWTIQTSAVWIGLIAFGSTFSFIGGILGDRRQKRKFWAAVGLLIEGVGLVLPVDMIADSPQESYDFIVGG